MADVAYISNERIKAPLRKAYFPGEPQAVMFSVHGGNRKALRHRREPAARAPRRHH